MTAKRRHLAVRLKQAGRRATPVYMLQSGHTRRVVNRFAEKVGLVYFGHVSSSDEDRKLVRGHTVSATHVDDHYAVGTFKGYDIAMLIRSDTVRTGEGRARRYHWLIMTFDLHVPSDVPSFYVGHRSRDDYYQAVAAARGGNSRLADQASYPSQFLAHYKLYTSPDRVLDVERLVTPDVSEVIATNFRGASLEVSDNTLYLYIERERPDEELLGKMLANGVWLAEIIDSRQ